MDAKTIPSPEETGSSCQLAIFINQEQVSDRFQVIDVHLDLALSKVSSATIRFLLDLDEAALFLDNNDMEPGRSLVIKAGYAGTDRELFSGTISANNFTAENGNSLFVIEGKSLKAYLSSAEKSKSKEPVLKIVLGESLISGSVSIRKSTLTFQGNYLVAPGKRIYLEGFGAKRNGPVTIKALHHHFSEGNWLTTAETEKVNPRGHLLLF